MKAVSKEEAQKVAVNFVRKKRSAERIDVSIIEEKDDSWIIQGTCPIDLEGHPWTEKFEAVINNKGKIKFTDFSLL